MTPPAPSNARKTAAALWAKRRRVRRRDLRAFVSVARTRWCTTALRAVVQGALVSGTLERRGLRPLLVSTGGPRPPVALAQEVARAVDAGLGLLPIQATCLRRSMTLLRVFDRLGWTADLHLGVRRTAGGVEAHAWIQIGGVVLNDDALVTATYLPLAVKDADRLILSM